MQKFSALFAVLATLAAGAASAIEVNTQNSGSDPATRVIVAGDQTFTGTGTFTVTQTVNMTRTTVITSVGTSPITGVRVNVNMLGTPQGQ